MTLNNGLEKLGECEDENSRYREGAFRHTAIRQIEFPATVTQIGDNAFQCCHELSRITFDGDSKLEKIGCNCFYSCNLEEFHAQPRLKMIGEGAF